MGAAVCGRTRPDCGDSGGGGVDVPGVEEGCGEERFEGKLGKKKDDGNWGEVSVWAVCRGVGANSVLCTACGKWCHKRCSGLGRLSAAAVSLFRCPACARGGAVGAVGLGGGVVGEVKQFCYLGDVLERGGGSQRAIRARVGAAWRKWKEMASMLVNRGFRCTIVEGYMKHALDLLCCMGRRRGNLLQDWRVYCLVVIEKCSGIWLESRGGIV